ncbi:lipid A deacylase LpxR family protein [Maribellus mangrovi]|uniref:lipid A deacylase LpxR family protein n=1 Tax=Maribellus mangrovi TaxID=3133146 RepID=UPI0030ED68A8
MIFSTPNFIYGQKLKELNYEKHKEFFLRWDNDVFLTTDYYYTQGAQLFWVNPKLRRNPASYFLIRLKNSDHYFGLGLIQEIFTPKDITDTLLNTIDRPYAGTLYLKSFVASANPEKRLKLTSEFDFGFLGPLSGARQAQEKIHDWLGSKPPKGWDFQIDNRIYLNYNLELEKEILKIHQIFDVTGVSRFRIGTIHDDLRLGGKLRIGLLNDYFKGLNLSNRKYTENKDFQFYFFGGAGVTGVLYDATLMGGIIPPENNQEYQFREIHHLLADLNFGLAITYKMISAKGTVTMISPKFENGESHGWGTISLFFRL